MCVQPGREGKALTALATPSEKFLGGSAPLCVYPCMWHYVHGSLFGCHCGSVEGLHVRVCFRTSGVLMWPSDASRHEFDTRRELFGALRHLLGTASLSVLTAALSWGYHSAQDAPGTGGGMVTQLKVYISRCGRF